MSPPSFVVSLGSLRKIGSVFNLAGITRRHPDAHAQCP